MRASAQPLCAKSQAGRPGTDAAPTSGSSYNSVFIDRLVKDFGLVLRGVVVYHVPGVSGTVCSGGLAGFRGRGCRGEGVL